MKKIISIALLLAMVLGILAGCNTPAENPLDAAVEYIKVMYDTAGKNEDNKLASDKELLPAVTIDGVSYPVVWTLNVTSGPSECIVLADGSNAGTQKISIAQLPEEEVRFTLIGTVSDAEGNTATVEIKYYSPAVEKVEVSGGEKIVLYFPTDGKYVTGIDYLYTSSSGTQKHELVLTDNKAEALPLTVQENDDGTVSFVTDGGLYLYCDATNVQYVAEQGDYTKFVLEPAEGGQYIKCAVANYNDKAQYLEVYSGYLTCYGMSETSNLALYIFELQDAEGASGVVGEAASDDNTGDNSGDGTITPDNSNDPAADSTLTVAEVIALGASKEHNTYTEGKYYVTGVITEVYNETYGNMKITDAAGNILTIYGTYDADGTNRYDAMEVKPVAGDTVTIYGVVGQYNDTPQVKNGWITAHTPAGSEGNAEPTSAVKIYYPDGQSYVTAAADGTKLAAGTDAEAAVWTVEIDANGYYIFSVDGKYMTSGDTGNSLFLSETLTDCGRWEVSTTDGGVLLRNVGANYNGTYNQYLEHYSGFTTYGLKETSVVAYYTFQLIDAE